MALIPIGRIPIGVGGSGHTPNYPHTTDWQSIMSRETLEWLNTMTLRGFVSRRGNSWHYKEALQIGDGNQYDGAIPFADAERLLNRFDVVEGPVMSRIEIPCDLSEADALDANGNPVKVITATDPDRKAIVRIEGGLILGIHSAGYAMHPYGPWLLDNVSNLLGDTLQIGSVGLLRQGAQAWVQIEAPENIQTPQGVTYRPHLLAVTSLDGSIPTSYRRCTTVVQCDNTLAGALAEGGEVFKVKHTRNSQLRIKDARQALGIVEQEADAFEKEVAEMCATTVTDSQWREFLKVIVGEIPTDDGRERTIKENKWNQLHTLWRTDPAVAPWKGTAWGALQAVNTWEHHMKTVKGVSRMERNQSRAITGDFEKTDRETVKVLAGILER